MITKKLSLTLGLLVIAYVFSSVFAQQKLIIQSKDDIRQIAIKNTKTNKKETISTWNKSGGGFLIKVDNLKDYQIVTEKTTVFKLLSLDKKQTTKWIELTKDKSISLQECFNKYLGETLSQAELSKSTSEFLVSNYLGNPMYEETMALRGSEDKLTFSDKNSKEFFTNEEIEIKWDTKMKIRHIYMVDITNPTIVWKSDNYPSTTLNINKIQSELKKPLETGHQYQINIVLENPHDANMEGEKYSYEFALRPLIFNAKNDISYFLAKDSINIQWKSKYKIKKAALKNVSANKTIWEQSNFDGTAVTFDKMKTGLKEELTPKVRYQLQLEIDDPANISNQYGYNFEIILTDKDLKDLLEFINSN